MSKPCSDNTILLYFLVQDVWAFSSQGGGVIQMGGATRGIKQKGAGGFIKWSHFGNAMLCMFKKLWFFFSAGLTTKIRVNNRKVSGDGIKEGGERC